MGWLEISNSRMDGYISKSTLFQEKDKLNGPFFYDSI